MARRNPDAARFRRSVELAFSADAILEHAQKELAAFAREDRDGHIAAGRFSPRYDTFVNGVPGAREETVRQGGVIVYRAKLLGEAAKAAVEELLKRAPRSVRNRPKWRGAPKYIDTFAVMVDRRDLVAASAFDPAAVPLDAAEIYVLATADYSRLLDVQIAGTRKITVVVPPFFFHDAADAVRRRYPALDVTRLGTVRWPGENRTLAGRRIEYPAIRIARTRLERL